MCSTSGGAGSKIWAPSLLPRSSFHAGANTRIQAFELCCTPGILNGFGAFQTMRNRLFNIVGKTALQVLHCSNSTLEGAKCHQGPWIDMNLISEITLMAVLQNSCSANAFTWSGTSQLSSISSDSPHLLGKMGSPRGFQWQGNKQ